jgi:ribonuclease Z
MFEIVFLGTSASAPSVYRGLSSAAILAGEDRFLVDAGEGTQRQILRSGIGFKKLSKIFVTHPHLDHLLGIGGLVSTFSRWETMEAIDIWGSKESLERIQALIYDVVLRAQTPTMPINLNRVKGESVIYKNKQFSITAFPVVHRGRGCYGYIFKEHDRRPFLVDKAEALGVAIGPERSQLVRGESVQLDDGRTITPDMVLGDAVEGIKVVFTGDVADTERLRPYVQGADVLVSEATFLQDDVEMARRYGHITAQEAGQLAKESGVRHLLLTHISRRYRERDIIAEARNTFESTTVVRDLDHFVVRRDAPLIKKTDED